MKTLIKVKYVEHNIKEILWDCLGCVLTELHYTPFPNEEFTLVFEEVK